MPEMLYPVEYAIKRLQSCCKTLTMLYDSRPMDATPMATIGHPVIITSLLSHTHPKHTSVAACMRADTMLGPSIASGSQC
jgi:transcription termination factor Rho